jgi:hypothetical protein
MQLVEARTELVLQRVGPADTLEPAARRAVRSAVLALPEHLESPVGTAFVRPGCVCVKSSSGSARFGLCCGGTGRSSAVRGGGEPSRIVDAPLAPSRVC